MVGKSVLLESIENPLIEKILLINRKKININHPKVEEIILDEFMNINTYKFIIQWIVLLLQKLSF